MIIRALIWHDASVNGVGENAPRVACWHGNAGHLTRARMLA